MQTATLSSRFRSASSSHRVLGLTLAAAIGCGGSEVGDDGTEPTPSGGAASTPGASAAPPGQGAASSNGQPPPVTTSPAADRDMPSNPNEGNTTPASVDNAGVGAACAELGTDACGACVCRECAAELDTCANTPGCPEILACVRDNGCSGTDCFCGDAPLARCFGGGSNGPCKDVVLAAPGGREPTLDNAGGGPASDAALEVGECADDDDSCDDVCDVGL